METSCESCERSNTSDNSNPFEDDQSDDSDLLELNRVVDDIPSQGGRVSPASLDVLQELALIDEGLRGIGSGTRQPIHLQGCTDNIAPLASNESFTKPRHDQLLVARESIPYDQTLPLQNAKLDGRRETGRDSDSLVVHCSDSPHVATPIASVRPGPSTTAIGPAINPEEYRDLGDKPQLLQPLSTPTSSSLVSSILRKPLPPLPGRNTLRFGAQAAGGSSSITSTLTCETCDSSGDGRHFCNVCELVYCESCWTRSPLHRERRLSSMTSHERTDYDVAKAVKNAMTPDLTEDELGRRYTDDMNTTWFGVFRQKGELPLLREYGRYTELIKQLKAARVHLAPSPSSSLQSERQHKNMYPSLVSFIGETGAGKSTLIKLLIDLKSPRGESFQTPVVGAVGREVATSDGVHLYLDPESFRDVGIQAPVLYADCEGLNGGARDPTGAKWREQFERNHQNEALTEDEPETVRSKHVSQRPLVWANSDRTQTRSFVVAHFYPRLLYTFSDVIVFVVKNPRVVETVLEQLLTWAEAALERSSNQPILPCAIIAFNACENNTPTELWDVDYSTDRLMASLSEAVHQNHIFQKYVQLWRKRNRSVVTVEQLLASYYKSIRVIRIPTTGRPNLIQQQVLKLSLEIQEASTTAQRRKRNLRMLFDAETLAPYLHFAIDHFAYSLDTPFDFVQASFAYNPIPMSFGGNILKVAIQVAEFWKDLIKAETILEELSYLVASCIMFDAARNQLKGSSGHIFVQYLDHIDDALENFCDRYWPCEFIGLDGQRCVNVRSGHQKGHQLKTGYLVTFDQYQSSVSFDEYRDEFSSDVYWKLRALTRRVQKGVKAGLSEVQAAVEVHRKILQAFFHHASRRHPGEFISHSVCLSCLKEVPEHALPCGHIICMLCLTTFGIQRHNLVDICECPIGPKDCCFEAPWTVQLKPENCGVRVLSLDGGGVRGLSEIEVMKEIERQLGSNLDIRSFFDLIVGTNSGAIIALGLTAGDWRLQKCSEQFEICCVKAFGKRIGSNVPILGRFLELFNGAKYDAQALIDHLQDTFTTDRYLFGGKQKDAEASRVKVAVTATSSAGQTVVLANYNRRCHDVLPYQFYRADKPQNEFQTWQAARAAFAAPGYFKPFRHPPSSQVLSDGSIGSNNPIEIAESERNLIWPDLKNEEPDLVVSIGTAHLERTPNRLQKRNRPTEIRRGYLQKREIPRHLFSTNPDEFEWVAYFCSRPLTHDANRYLRLSAPSTAVLPKVDDIQEGFRLQQEMKFESDDPHIQEVVKRLVASCFYFDTDSDYAERQLADTQSHEVRGNLRCRLTSKSDVTGLGNFIQRHATSGQTPYFLIENEGDEPFHSRDRRNTDQQLQTMQLSPRIIERMKSEGLFRMDEALYIRSTTKSARTKISLCFELDGSFPISRFPRPLHDGLSAQLAKQPEITPRLSAQWASRPNIHRQLAEERIRLADKEPLGSADVIELYCGDSHFLGRASEFTRMDSSFVDGLEPHGGFSPFPWPDETDADESSGHLINGGYEGLYAPGGVESEALLSSYQRSSGAAPADMGSSPARAGNSTHSMTLLELMGNPIHELLGTIAEHM